MRFRFVVPMSFTAAALALSGCSGDSSSSSTGDGGPTTGDGGTCVTGATGTVSVNVTGLPAGIGAKVKVTGPSGDTNVTSTQSITSAASGSYSVTAEIVTAADPVVRSAFTPRVSASSFCLEGGATETVDVTYTMIPTSNKLWHTNANDQSGEVLGFASSLLRITGTHGASVAMKGGAGKAVAFDRDGNLWTLGPTTADAPLARFAASDLGTSGDKTPDRKINLDVPCSPGLTDLAFEKSGALWVTSACEKRAIKLTPSQLAQSGDVTEVVPLSSGIQDPEGIAFDNDDNLWIADRSGVLLHYNPGRVAMPAITPREASTPAGPGAVLAPSRIAFDAAGNLWATNFGGNSIYKIMPAQQTSTGDVVPSVIVTIGVTALLEGMAFDEAGGLWITYSQGKLARLSPSQLGMSTGPGSPTVPEVVLTSGDIGFPGAMAFFPAPAALPLFHRLP